MSVWPCLRHPACHVLLLWKQTQVNKFKWMKCFFLSGIRWGPVFSVFFCSDRVIIFSGRSFFPQITSFALLRLIYDKVWNKRLLLSEDFFQYSFYYTWCYITEAVIHCDTHAHTHGHTLYIPLYLRHLIIVLNVFSYVTCYLSNMKPSSTAV